MTFYVCSCGVLFGERREAFDQCCKLKGHTLFEVSAGLYRLVYEIQESHAVLKETVRKRNRSVAILRKRIDELEAELRAVRAI